MTFATFEIKDTEKGCNLFGSKRTSKVISWCSATAGKVRISTCIVERKGRDDWVKRSIGCSEG